MIPVHPTGDLARDTRDIIHSINHSETVLPLSIAPGSTAIVSGAAAVTLGGCHVDRTVFRKLLPDDRWLIYAAGEVNPGDGNALTITLRYSAANGTLTTLGTIGPTGAGVTKVAMGPFDVFATVPPTDPIPGFVLQAAKAAGVNGTAARWCLWLRLLTRNR